MFKEKNILISGSARNTGLGIAKVFGRYGANVFIHGRPDEQVEELVDTLNCEAGTSSGDAKYFPVTADLTSENEITLAFELIEQRVGGLDVMVNNACHLGLGFSFLDMPISFFDEVLTVNLRAYTLCAQLAARQMIKRGGGAIVNIGSNTAQHALADRVAYITSKGGVESLTRAIALELAEHNIRVNCVVPGYIHTNRWDTLPEEIKQRRRKNIPLGRESSAEDIGETVAFLASEKAGSITGTSLVVSGGIDAQLVPPDCAD